MGPLPVPVVDFPASRAAGQRCNDSAGFDRDPDLSERAKDLAVEQFIAQRSVEAFAIAFRPRTSLRDMGAYSRRTRDQCPALFARSARA